MSGEFSYPEEVIRANNAAHAELRERAERAEGAEAELDKRRRLVEDEVTSLVDMIGAMPDRPGVVRVRALRSKAARVRAVLTWARR